jgi:DNA-binding SARP family transcriptional activator
LADALIDARTPRTYQGNTNISLLGGFQSCVNGESVELPPGHVRGLVKLLAVRSRPITTDVAVDHLWPDVSLDVGRRRLKNVVSRIRTRLGPDAIHRTSATVALGDHVRVDVRQFVSAADRVGQAGRASEAVNLYAGPLLPEDLYEDWVDPIRHSLADRALNLTLQAMLQESPDAGWLVGSLRRIGPPTEESWLDVAEYAIEGNDLVRARECLNAAADKIVDLGVTPPKRMTELEARLRSASV